MSDNVCYPFRGDAAHWARQSKKDPVREFREQLDRLAREQPPAAHQHSFRGSPARRPLGWLNFGWVGIAGTISGSALPGDADALLFVRAPRFVSAAIRRALFLLRGS